ncbi:transcription factor, RsfA family [Amphibacillus marinus]|uniref:Transcription factor, RsfA family n=1 Tax=Amphibacillus marinus TaxID=872970 RepID=A0A1H8I6F9_9BACI|nr:hypothetical protein [Amphibacillus marinus]SEN63862.1 transcription factor, RsfA family [Amphibacillus marinus]
MSVNRQDAWTQEEDQLLAGTVIDYIKSGRTQLESFKEVARKLNRTPAACGFRWNATIRKHHNEAIQTAKQSRKRIAKQSIEFQQEQTDTFSLDQAIQWLEKVKHNFDEQGNEQKHSYYKAVSLENERLAQELVFYHQLMERIEQLIKEVKVR